MRRRLGIGVLVAVFLSAGAVKAFAGGGDYNSNPTYCHGASEADFLWWWFECWLPDPPGTPY
jgi:hypothetical protein